MNKMGFQGEQNRNQYLTLRKILEGTASHTGKDFFLALVKTLAEVLNTKGAWVTEYLPEKRTLRALAFWVEDHFVDEYEYEIKGTPCENVLSEEQLIHVPENVIDLFPDDPDLKPFGAVSYLGAPLLDLDGTILGHLAVQDIRPMPEKARNVALFQIFADRAASELRRIRAETKLIEREEQLQRLLDSAMDAIIEIDSALNIVQVNTAAAQLFEGGQSASMQGGTLANYLTDQSAGKLKNLLKGLKNQRPKKRSLWIPGGFKACTSNGKEFQAEATLSCYEHNRKTYYNLVLRNVTDRIEAEKRIDILNARSEYLQEEIRQIHQVDDMIGNSKAMHKVREQISRVSRTNAAVLIHGETGTGKELVARSIHANSLRKDHPMVKVNCAAISASLIESEFFGHEQGAFTGATEKREGRFALADGGTIFLDEIGELPLELQSKLLRVLQEGEFEPVGSSKTQKVDVRIIAATNRDLKKMTSEGIFREDLFYRLHVFPIHVPPLRDRDDDVIQLAEAFLNQFTHQSGLKVSGLTNKDIHYLKTYNWPGNIRELRNIIERTVITSTDGYLNLSSFLTTSDREEITSGVITTQKIYTAVELQELERESMKKALEEADWKVSGKKGAAEFLGIPPTTFYSRMKTLGIKRA